MTLRLNVDHCGCIVNDLVAGAAQWERLGFALTPMSRQRGAIPGRDGFHPWATANRCAILQNSYLELIGVVDAQCHNPWARFLERNEGLHILAMRCENADAAYAEVSSRTDALLPPVPRERMLDVDGEERAMRFRNIFSRDERWPEACYLVIEHQTPEYLWQPRYQSHENGACDLVAATLVADEPSALRPRLEAFGAIDCVTSSERISARLPGRGTLHVVRRDAYADTYGYVPEARSGMHAMTVSFSDLNRALDLLETRGVRFASGSRGHWISPQDANGFVLQLVESNKHS